MTHSNSFGLILDIVYETMPRDNLLNSACLELFDCIRRGNIKPLIHHVVEKYREKLQHINYVDMFQNLILRYDQMQGYGADVDSALFSQDEGGTPQRMPLNGQRWQGVKEMDAAEEEYFNTSDDEDEVGDLELLWALRQATDGIQWPQDTRAALAVPNGSASPVVKPLVDYPDDDSDEDVMDTKAEGLPEQLSYGQTENLVVAPASPQTPLTPERLAEKRRREEEDDDELIKLTAGPKRRSSSSSNSSAGFLRRKNGLSIGSMATAEKGVTLGNVTGGTAPRRIAINLGPTIKPTVSDSEIPGADNAVSTENTERRNRDNSLGDEGG